MNIAFKIALTAAALYVPFWLTARSHLGLNEKANIACVVTAGIAMVSALVGVWMS